MQIQDLGDVAGDKARGRWAGTLVLGDRPCCWSITVLVPFQSVVSIEDVGTNPGLHSIVNQTGSLHDKVTSRIWNAWLVGLYMVPLAGQGA